MRAIEAAGNKWIKTALELCDHEDWRARYAGTRALSQAFASLPSLSNTTPEEAALKEAREYHEAEMNWVRTGELRQGVIFDEDDEALGGLPLRKEH
jgi:hypothetical protein